MSETPLEELIRRARTLVTDRGKFENQGNGFWDRTYQVGGLELTIDGVWVGNEQVRQGLLIDDPFVCLLEVEDMDGRHEIHVFVNDVIVNRVLDKVRRHMILDDLADV